MGRAGQSSSVRNAEMVPERALSIHELSIWEYFVSLYGYNLV